MYVAAREVHFILPSVLRFMVPTAAVAALSILRYDDPLEAVHESIGSLSIKVIEFIVGMMGGKSTSLVVTNALYGYVLFFNF